MSSGHRKGGEEPGPLSQQRFRQALQDPRFQQWLNRNIKVNMDWPIPYLGGSSQDGHTVYIDRGFRDARDMPFLIVHEVWEKTCLDVWGLGYLPCHCIATVAEHDAVRKAGRNPRQYEAGLRPYITTDEAEPTTEQLPPDLEMAPYKGSKWERKQPQARSVPSTPSSR